MAKVVRALYGLPVAGAAFRSCLGSNLRTLEYFPMKADPDLWMKPAVKSDGTEYYEYLLAYVDNLCGVSMDTKNKFDSIGDLFTIKKESVKEPDLYLGADIVKVQLPSEPGKTRCAMSSMNCTKKVIEEVERADKGAYSTRGWLQARIRSNCGARCKTTELLSRTDWTAAMDL